METTGLSQDAQLYRKLGIITPDEYIRSFRMMYPGAELAFWQQRIPISVPKMTQLGVEEWKYNLALQDEEFREKQIIVLCCGGDYYMKVGNARMKLKFDSRDRLITAFLLTPYFPIISQERAFVRRLEDQVEQFRNDPRNLCSSENIRGMWILPETETPRGVDITSRL